MMRCINLELRGSLSYSSREPSISSPELKTWLNFFVYLQTKKEGQARPTIYSILGHLFDKSLCLSKDRSLVGHPTCNRAPF